ncbi:MAG: helix-turn-helix domain-containing protein [Lactobacillales bacterium]|jgi:hypothetical protein|nr:helix-turn-helix domain-containing protein [Lactobacillales bacterium]
MLEISSYLLENHQLVKLSMIEELMKNEDSSIIYTELAHLLKVKPCNLERYIKELSADLFAYGLDDKVKIHLFEGQVFGTISIDYHPILLERLYIMESVGYQLFGDIFFNHFRTLTYFVDENELTMPSVNLRIKRLNEFLSKYALKLNFRKKKCPLIGKEKQIRYFAFCLFSSIQEGGDWLFSSRLHESIPERFISLLINAGMSQNYFFNEKMKVLIAVTLIRVRGGYEIEENVEDLWLLDNPLLSYTNFRREFFLPMANETKIHACNKEKECLFFYFLFSCLNTYMMKDCTSLASNLLNFYSCADCKFSQMWLEQFQQDFKLPLSVELYSCLLVNLYYLHRFVTVFSGNYFGYNGEGVIERFAVGYPEELSQMQQFIDHLKEIDEIGFESLVENNSYLLFQYGIILKAILERHISTLYLVYLSKTSSLQVNIMKTRLFSHSPVRIIFQETINSKTDGVITDFPISSAISKGKPVFNLHPVPTNQEKKNIWLFISELTREKLLQHL